MSTVVKEVGLPESKGGAIAPPDSDPVSACLASAGEDRNPRGPLVDRQGRINLLRPGVYSALQILYLLETGARQQLQGPG